MKFGSKKIERTDELSEFDDEFAYFHGEWSHLMTLYEEVVVAFLTFTDRHAGLLIPEEPSAFQDGSLLTVAQECLSIQGKPAFRTSVLGGFYFSRYGRLFVRTALDQRSAIPLVAWNAMSESLTNEFDFIEVDNQVLDSKYSGGHEKFCAMTWGERLFAPWYQNLEAGAA